VHILMPNPPESPCNTTFPPPIPPHLPCPMHLTTSHPCAACTQDVGIHQVRVRNRYLGKPDFSMYDEGLMCQVNSMAHALGHPQPYPGVVEPVPAGLKEKFGHEWLEDLLLYTDCAGGKWWA
jgi:hypothetical protein